MLPDTFLGKSIPILTEEFDMMGAILAAGAGTRMAQLGTGVPKPMLPVCNKPVIEYQIATMQQLGIDEIVILISRQGTILRNVLGDGSSLGVRLHYIEQSRRLGIAYALGQLESTLTGPFMLMLGDIYFAESDLSEMLRIFKQSRCSGVLGAKHENDVSEIEKNFAIIQNADGRVIKVIEKPRKVPSTLKGVGLYLFDSVIFDAIRRTPRTAMRDEYELTEAVQRLIDDGEDVRVSKCIKHDINLTFPSDLLRCNLLALRLMGCRSFVDASAKLHPDAKLESAVIGPRVIIKNGITIRHSVILENSVVDSEFDIEGKVISPYSVIDAAAQLPTWLC